MFDFDAIKSVKSNIKTNGNEAKSDEVLKDALKDLESFHNLPPNKEKLKDVAKKFIEVIKFKRNRVEPYVYLAYIFFQINQNDLAVKYLKIARDIDPVYPQIEELKQMILMNNFSSESILNNTGKLKLF